MARMGKKMEVMHKMGETKVWVGVWKTIRKGQEAFLKYKVSLELGINICIHNCHVFIELS